MRTIENNNQDKCIDNLPQKDPPIKERCWSILNNNDAINEEGCRFFVNLKKPIYISSYELRWFTYKFDPKHTKQLLIQQKARKVVTDEAQQSPKKSGNLSMSILLYANPVKLKDEESEYIKLPLKCQDVTIKY